MQRVRRALSQPRQRRWVLDPAGELYDCWISAMVLPVLYSWVVLVCRCCFADVQEEHARLWLGLDGLCDVLYLLDMAARLHTGFLEDGILVTEPARTRRHYLCSWALAWDAASVLPTELLRPWLALPVPALRFNRCLRAARLREALERRETRTRWPRAFRMARLVLGALLAIHWGACLYFALSVRLGLGADAWVCPRFTRPLRRYLHSAYVATLILTTVGDTPMPRREEEFLFAAAGFLLAVLGFATVTGGTAAALAPAGGTATQPQHDALRRYLRARGAGRARALLARWRREPGALPPAERGALGRLPGRLRAELAASAHLRALRAVALFGGCERGVLRELVLRLRPRAFAPGELVCRRGDVGREMFFVREGRLAVLAEDGVTALAVLGEGLYFGEISLINIPGNRSGNRRTADIRSIGYSDLFCLSKEDLAEVLAEFPAARAAMEAKGRELLQRMGRLDAAAAAAAAAAERRARELEAALGALQGRAARLLAQLEAGAVKLALRVERLERRLRPRGRGQGP
ncbi:cyclic nucleotide-gated channel alpha-4 [Eudromia elegans]